MNKKRPPKYRGFPCREKIGKSNEKLPKISYILKYFFYILKYSKCILKYLFYRLLYFVYIQIYINLYYFLNIEDIKDIVDKVLEEKSNDKSE